jgi:hypothetical protein
LMSLLTPAKNTADSSAPQPKPFWNTLLLMPSKFTVRFSCSKAPTKRRRGSLGQGFVGILNIFSTTPSNPAASNHFAYPAGDSSGVPKAVAAARSSRSYSLNWLLSGTVPSSQPRVPLMHWNSSHPPGLRCLLLKLLLSKVLMCREETYLKH